MDKISLLNPTVGIESIDRYESGRMSLPAGGDAQIVGGQVPQSAPTLYKGESVSEVARGLMAPGLPDPALMQPTRFIAAFLDVADKMESGLGRAQTPHAGLIWVREHKERCEHVFEKKAELTGGI